MTLQIEFTDEPNDRLLARLLHVEGVAPTYRQLPDSKGGLHLLSAVVYIDGAYWPLPWEQTEAIIKWVTGKCDIGPEGVTFQALPGSAPLPSSTEPVPRLRRPGDLPEDGQ